MIEVTEKDETMRGKTKCRVKEDSEYIKLDTEQHIPKIYEVGGGGSLLLAS